MLNPTSPVDGQPTLEDVLGRKIARRLGTCPEVSSAVAAKLVAARQSAVTAAARGTHEASAPLPPPT